MEKTEDISFYINKFSKTSDKYGDPHLSRILLETHKHGLKDLTLEECKKYYEKYFSLIESDER